MTVKFEEDGDGVEVIELDCGAEERLNYFYYEYHMETVRQKKSE